MRINPLLVLSSLALTGLAGSGCSLAHAEMEPQADVKNRTLSVSGSGSVRVKPDIATAVLGTSKTMAKLPEAKSSTDAIIAQIRSALKKAGVSDDDVQTVQYQIYRVNANPGAGIRESGWKVIHMIQVRTKKPETIAGLVDTAVAAGATDISNIDFSLDSLGKHRARARELAVQAATEKAKQLASLTGVSLGPVVSVVENGDGGGYQYYQSSANVSMDYSSGRGGGSGISGGQVEVGVSTSIVFEIR